MFWTLSDLVLREYIKGAYAVMIVCKKNFRLVPDCRGKVTQVSQVREMRRKQGNVCACAFSL